jgi:hypothetical protein
VRVFVWKGLQGGGPIFSQLPQFPQIFRKFPKFPQFLWGYRNFPPWEYLIPQFLEGVQNHNMWFKIHNFCFEHPFLSKFMKFDYKCVKNILCLVLPGLDFLSPDRNFPQFFLGGGPATAIPPPELYLQMGIQGSKTNPGGHCRAPCHFISS